MLQRFAIALVGACAVTFVLMFGMSAIAEYFNQPDSQVYLRVMDVIPGSAARRMPERRMPEAQPERARVDTDPVAVTRPPANFSLDGASPPVEVEVELQDPADAR